MPAKKSKLLTLSLLILFASACNAQPTRSQPTQIVEPTSAPPASTPVTEADVPRVTVTDAKAALDSAAAVIVDVRSPAAFQMSHVAGAISIPLADIEANPTGLKLDKDQWIITYCT
jgi:3-mercaptopyruvate sulfurtransferase SseA